MSDNFEFLKEFEDLYSFAKTAEDSIYTNPERSMLSMRGFVEKLVYLIYREFKIHSGKHTSLDKKLNNQRFIFLVGYDVLPKLHAVRMVVNKTTAHPERGDFEIPEDDRLAALKNVFEIALWYCNVKGKLYDKPEFIEPPKQSISQNTEETRKQIALEKQKVDEIAKIENIPENNVEDFAAVSAFKENSKKAFETLKLDNTITNRFLARNDDLANYFKDKDDINLTFGQKELLRHIEEFLQNPDKRIFLLKGYAGTGKTFIVKGLTKYLNNAGRFYKLAAPTGKAARVLSRKSEAEATTIHGMIYSINSLKEYNIEGVENSATYRFYADINVNEDPANTVYIIDESSMISDSDTEGEFIKFGSGVLLKDLLQYVNLDHNDHDKKVIFIGDPAQLPPPASVSKYEDKSPALSIDVLTLSGYVSKDEIEEYLLTEVVRQKKGDILSAASQIRTALEHNDYTRLSFRSDYNDLELVTDFEQTFSKVCDLTASSLKETMVISDTNARVSELNQLIRRKKFPNAPFDNSGKTQLQIGDKVIITRNSKIDDLYISNGEFAQIKSIGNEEIKNVTLRSKNKKTGQNDERQVELRYLNVEILFKTRYSMEEKKEISDIKNVKIIENLLYNDNPDLSSDEKKAQYVEFKKRIGSSLHKGIELKDAMRNDPYFNALCIKFGYAITCHKAQGSEWDNVIVDVGKRSKDFRWLYTAITRAKKHLYLLNFEKFDIGSNMKKPLRMKETKESSFQETTNEKIFATPDISPLELVKLHVLECIKNSEISLEEVQSYQYMNKYIFSQCEKRCSLNLYYNDELIIKKCFNPHPDDFSKTAEQLLSRLIGLYFGTTPEKKDPLTDDFKINFDKRISQIADDNNAKIIGLREMDYVLRYTFAIEGRKTTLDFSYGKNKDFTAAPKLVKNKSSSGYAAHLTKKDYDFIDLIVDRLNTVD